jgi:hypothetical protein
MNLPITLTLNTHSFNLGEIKRTLKEMRVVGSSSFLAWRVALDDDVKGNNQGEQNTSEFYDLSVVDLFHHASDIKFKRNGEFVNSDINLIELNDNEEIMVGIGMTINSRKHGTLTLDTNGARFFS